MTEAKPTDMRVQRVRVRLTERRFLFGRRVNESGFLSDRGRVFKLTATARPSRQDEGGAMELWAVEVNDASGCLVQATALNESDACALRDQLGDEFPEGLACCYPAFRCESCRKLKHVDERNEVAVLRIAVCLDCAEVPYRPTLAVVR